MNKTKNIIALAIAGISYGSFGIWIRFLSNELTSYQQIFVRNFLGLLFSLLFVFFLKQKINFGKINKMHLALYALSFPVTQVFYTFSILNAKLGITMFSFFAAAFISSFIIGKIYFNDKANTTKLISLTLAFIGLIILSYRSFSQGLLNWGFVFGFVAGCLDSVTNTGRRLLGGKIDRFVLVAIQMVGGILISLAFLFFFKQSVPVDMSMFTFSIAVIFGLLLMGLNILMNFGFNNFDLNLGTIILSIELIAAPVFGFFIFKETLAAGDILGGIFIFAGIIVSNLPERNRIKLII